MMHSVEGTYMQGQLVGTRRGLQIGSTEELFDEFLKIKLNDCSENDSCLEVCFSMPAEAGYLLQLAEYVTLSAVGQTAQLSIRRTAVSQEKSTFEAAWLADIPKLIEFSRESSEQINAAKKRQQSIPASIWLTWPEKKRHRYLRDEERRIDRKQYNGTLESMFLYPMKQEWIDELEKAQGQGDKVALAADIEMQIKQ